MEKNCNNCMCNTCMYKNLCSDSYDCMKELYRGFDKYLNHMSECKYYMKNCNEDKNIGKQIVLFEEDFTRLGLSYSDFINKNKFGDRVYIGMCTGIVNDMYEIHHHYSLGKLVEFYGDCDYVIYFPKELMKESF